MFLLFGGLGLISLLFILVSPLLLVILSPLIFLLIVTFIVIPLLAKIGLEKLEMYKYIFTEYLYDLSDYKLKDKERPYDNLGGYKRYYRAKREEEERKKRAYERSYRSYTWGPSGGWEEASWDGSNWEDFFKDYSQGGQGGPTGGLGFRENYEKACRTLGLDYGAGEEEIKAAYRKMAKKYHPDMNKDRDTTEDFQKINDAYEFLNSENIRRYRNI